MKALVQTKAGEPIDALEIREVTGARPAANEVSITVSMTSMHHGDLFVIRSLKDLAETPLRLRGSEAIGVVESLGSDAPAHLSVGARVLAFAPGAWTERMIVDARNVFPAPDWLPDKIGAQLLINAVTARMVLRAIRKSVSVETLSHGIVLVSGAGTAVSKLLSRFMKQEGLTVIGLTRSEGTAAHVRSLAPDVEIVSTDTAGWKKKVRSLAGRRNIVAVADCVSGALTGAMAELLVDDGPIITFGGLSSEPIGLTGLQVTSRQLQIRGVTVGRWFTATSEATRQDDVDAALAIARSHPELFGVSDIFAFDEFSDAVREVERPDRRGFVLMRP